MGIPTTIWSAIEAMAMSRIVAAFDENSAYKYQYKAKSLAADIGEGICETSTTDFMWLFASEPLLLKSFCLGQKVAELGDSRTILQAELACHIHDPEDIYAPADWRHEEINQIDLEITNLNESLDALH